MAGDAVTHADETRIAAALIEHPWDARAIDWPDLTPSSVVVEVGGYKGRWALQIAERYGPWMLVFEPQPWAAQACREVLQGTSFHVFEYALGTVNGVAFMGEWETDGCSIVKDDSAEHQVKIVEIGQTFRDIGITDRVALMLINIEGYEYQLIPHMLDEGILPDRLIVQFHTFADPGGMQQAAIYARLAALGYRILWTYGVVLTAWERRV